MIKSETYKESNHEPVMVKLLRTEYPAPEELDLFEYGYRLCRKIPWSWSMHISPGCLFVLMK